MSGDATAPVGTSLVAEQVGAHVLIHARDEPQEGDSFLATLSDGGSGELFVLLSRAARESGSVVEALPDLLRRYSDAGSFWIGLPGLAAAPARAAWLAGMLSRNVYAPDGGFSTRPGAAAFAGHGMGGTGWWRFSPDAPAMLAGVRFPVLRWEHLCPARPISAGPVVVEPIPAGVLVRRVADAPASTGHPASAVPADARFPQIVVGPGEAAPPDAVAEILNRMRDARPSLVVMAPDAAAHTWLAELALRSRQEFRFRPAGRYQPFQALLSQTAGGGDQHVLEISAPPPGWVTAGPRSYRHGHGTEAVFADVVPSGLVLRREDGKLAAEIGPFDPAAWSLVLGSPGEVVGIPLLVAADHLLSGLDPHRRATVRVRVAGALDPEAATALERLATQRPSAARRPVRTTPAPSRPAGTAGNPVRPAAPAATSEPEATVSASLAPRVAVAATDPSSSSARPTTAWSGAPVVTVAEPRRRPAVEVSAEPPAAEPESLREPAAPPTVRQPAQPQEPAVHELEPAVAGPAEDEGPVAPVVLKDRASTTAEQNRFTSGAGEAFNQALATVNAALAAWPSMRQQGGTSGAKADYVAVCLYLGTGETGGAELNDAVRAGRKSGVDGQIPCLVSGLRRLPTHRRAVLRQGRVDDSLEYGAAPGSLLVEPGFLSASTELDVTLPGADLDVLIWPATARRTSELVVGRPISETVFAAGARFKALAVRTDEADSEDEEVDRVIAPRTAALFRELAPDEDVTAELTERDLHVLEKLDRVLARRRKAELRVVDDPGIVSRLTGSMLKFRAETGQSAMAVSR
ncbi:hypothetical protein SAMN05421837_1031011 [Amycolatopsis pretoriensis]|uniref:Uncharacterized protein n=1 Tax=Amycolatopsis pretoriensis TaxID=218821 RepID=A0A1H5QNT9_9PSEU|nr:hypothetical protein [Amycolatopsis pretoriensis]SEF27729.1 hypothetical protein SAMN05421837_1031011 [Amycolatopsis pretoriensis]